MCDLLTNRTDTTINHGGPAFWRSQHRLMTNATISARARSAIADVRGADVPTTNDVRADDVRADDARANDVRANAGYHSDTTINHQPAKLMICSLPVQPLGA